MISDEFLHELDALLALDQVNLGKGLQLRLHSNHVRDFFRLTFTPWDLTSSSATGCLKLTFSPTTISGILFSRAVPEHMMHGLRGESRVVSSRVAAFLLKPQG